MTTLERLIASWQASSKLHSFRRGATAFEIKFFETSAGWKLPTEWREFYAFANGADLFDGEVLGGGWVQIRPLLGVASLLDGSQYWRDRYHWPVPDELWIAGESEGEAAWKFGLWLPSVSREADPVVEMRRDFGMTVGGSSLSAFLLARTTYGLITFNAPDAAFDALGVPPELRGDDSPEGVSPLVDGPIRRFWGALTPLMRMRSTPRGLESYSALADEPPIHRSRGWPAIVARRDAQGAHAAGKMGGALQTMNQPAAMPGLAVNLRQREGDLDRV